MRDMRLISTPQSHMMIISRQQSSRRLLSWIWDSLLDSRTIRRCKMWVWKFVLKGQGSDEVFYGYYPLIIGWVFSIERERLNTTNIVLFCKTNELKLSGVTEGFSFSLSIWDREYLQKLQWNRTAGKISRNFSLLFSDRICSLHLSGQRTDLEWIRNRSRVPAINRCL